jgi:hypothetical protein
MLSRRRWLKFIHQREGIGYNCGDFALFINLFEK